MIKLRFPHMGLGIGSRWRTGKCIMIGLPGPKAAKPLRPMNLDMTLTYQQRLSARRRADWREIAGHFKSVSLPTLNKSLHFKHPPLKPPLHCKVRSEPAAPRNKYARCRRLLSLVTRDCTLRSIVLSPKSTTIPPKILGLT